MENTGTNIRQSLTPEVIRDVLRDFKGYSDDEKTKIVGDWDRYLSGDLKSVLGIDNVIIEKMTCADPKVAHANHSIFLHLGYLLGQRSAQTGQRRQVA